MRIFEEIGRIVIRIPVIPSVGGNVFQTLAFNGKGADAHGDCSGLRADGVKVVVGNGRRSSKNIERD